MNQYSHKPNSGQESHLDPANESIVKDDEEYLSTCCGANANNEIIDGLAICSYCGEHAEFTKEAI